MIAIAALIGYLRWDDAGPEVRLLLLARAAGAWWERLVRQQELDGAYTVLDLDRHPVLPAARADHFRRASIAFAAYRDPGAPPADVPPPAELDDPAYGDPLLIHIAALLRTVQTSATPPPGSAEDLIREDSTAAQAGLPVRQKLLEGLCERERNRWYQLGSHPPFNPDLPLVDQVVALATLTAAGDQPCATSMLGALPNQAEVARIGAEALVVWAHQLYSGPGYWNPLRPDLLAEQHLADTAQLSFLAAALSQIVHLVVTTDHAELADLVSLALQLAPQPALAASLARQMPHHSVQLAALAATLTSQQVTHYRAGTVGGEPDAAGRPPGR